MTSQWIPNKYVRYVLAGLMLDNRLALTVALKTGMRIGDVLEIPTTALKHNSYTYTEQKTKKNRTVKLDYKLRKQLKQIAGQKYVFEHRLDPNKHRTRQAVYYDLVRLAKAYHLHNLTPHSMRKCYAVSLYDKNGKNIDEIQRELNHTDKNVTLLYALADILSKKNEFTF